VTNATQLLQQQVNYLVEQGESFDDAINKVNQSQFARHNGVSIKAEDVLHHDFNKLKKQYKAIAPLLAEHQASLLNMPQLSTAIKQLQQQLSLINAGWKTLRMSFLYNLFYIFLLTCLVLFFYTFLTPQFEEMFSGFGFELPAITRIALGPIGFWILLIIWFICLAYLYLFLKTSYHIKTYQALPGWLGQLPFLKQFKNIVDSLMLLSFLEFIRRTNLQASENIKQQIQLSLKINPEMINYYHDMFVLSDELDSSKLTLQNERNQLESQFVELSSSSNKLISVLFSLVLILGIGFYIIAMYAPIFQLGSVI
jgi:hypothetical protein